MRLYPSVRDNRDLSLMEPVLGAIAIIATRVYTGRQHKLPKHVSGSAELGRRTSSTKLILKAMSELFDRIVDSNLLVRRVAVTAGRVVDEAAASKEAPFEQLDLFTDYEAAAVKQAEEEAYLARERQIQKALLAIKGKYGRNAVMKGMNLQEGGMTVVRNHQIGGHRA